jgi:5-methylcytosine-specific restriction endonuclease McrA
MADVLLLNADAQPVSYLPISTISWKEAILYMYLDKCTVLEWYDDWLVHSMQWETKVPAVIILKDFVRQKTQVRFSKSNVYLRDQYTCLYCECGVTRTNATLDHVLPLSKGGKTNWENIATACYKCNATKANKTVMKPKYKPYQPGYWELVRKRKMLPFEVKHPSWEKWIDYEKIG